MGDKRETYVTAWTSAQERDLLKQGWTQVGRAYLHENDSKSDYMRPCWPVMAPPAPTLAEQLRVFSEEHPGHAPLHHRAADALERLTKIESLAREVVEIPHPWSLQADNPRVVHCLYCKRKIWDDFVEMHAEWCVIGQLARALDMSIHKRKELA